MTDTVTHLPRTDAARRRTRRARRARRWTLVRSRLAGQPLMTAALVVLVIFVLVAVLAPWLAPFDPGRQQLRNRNLGPGGDHWLGTDGFGRDQLSRLIHGARSSLLAGLIALAVGVVVGAPAGVIAGYARRGVDTVLSCVSDALMSVPALVLALTVVGVLGPGLVNAMVAVGIIIVPRFFRTARAATVRVRSETFIEGAVSIGCRRRRVLGAHIIPNIVSPVMVQAPIVFGSAIAAEAGLSFLGIGVQPPTPSWGSMLATALQDLDVKHLIWPPGIAIAITVLATMLLGDGLRQLYVGGSGDIDDGPEDVADDTVDDPALALGAAR